MPEIDIQGHRGARGHLPENTLAGFLRALELGATTLEMDAVISADGKVVLSHDPWFSSEICTKPDGTAVTVEEERELVLYKMTYAQIKDFDCGSRAHPRFPGQQAVKAPKPLLHDVIRASEVYVTEQGIEPCQYSVETKSRPNGDGVYHPDPETFAWHVHNALQEEGVLERSIVQSFDERTLQAARRLDPHWKTSLLVESEDDEGLDANLRRLGFTPSIYSPEYRLVDRGLVEQAHELGMQVIPWTVNERGDMQHLVDLGVDGIITDYPDVAVSEIRRMGG